MEKAWCENQALVQTCITITLFEKHSGSFVIVYYLGGSLSASELWSRKVNVPVMGHLSK